LSGRRIVAAALACLILTGTAALAAAPEDRVLAPALHTTEKARSLAVAHARALRELNADIYHCWPWVEVQKGSIGFFRPKHVARDDRYMSIRIYIEQDPSPSFGRLPFEERAAAMFSRYVGPLLRRMTRDPGVASDAALDGFTIILEWLKQAPPVNGRPVHETIAVFSDRAVAVDYLSGRADARSLAARARVIGFDGETPLGSVRLAPTWDDNFVSTYKVKNYQLEPGVAC
jgi:hypothetical protein